MCNFDRNSRWKWQQWTKEETDDNKRNKTKRETHTESQIKCAINSSRIITRINACLEKCTSVCRCCYLNQFMWQLCNLYTRLPFVCKNPLYISLFHAHMREQRIAEKNAADFVVYEVFAARVYIFDVNDCLDFFFNKKNRKLEKRPLKLKMVCFEQRMCYFRFFSYTWAE